jgi:hypothetical protein
VGRPLRINGGGGNSLYRMSACCRCAELRSPKRPVSNRPSNATASKAHKVRVPYARAAICSARRAASCSTPKMKLTARRDSNGSPRTYSPGTSVIPRRDGTAEAVVSQNRPRRLIVAFFVTSWWWISTSAAQSAFSHGLLELWTIGVRYEWIAAVRTRRTG